MHIGIPSVSDYILVYIHAYRARAMLYSDPSLPIPMWHSPVRRRTPNLQKSFSVDDMVSASYAVVLAPRVLMWFGRGFWPLAAGHENHTVIKLGRTTRMYGLNPYRSSTIGSHAAASCDCSIQQATSAHPSGLLGPMYSHINRKLFTLPRQLDCLFVGSVGCGPYVSNT